VTSIADPSFERRRPSWLRFLLLVLLLALLALQSPPPWGRLWLLIPLAVAVALLAAWRFGRWGVLVPVASFAAGLGFAGSDSLWVWWIPAAALSGTWMGLREEGGGPPAGERAWMLLPVLLFAAGVAWMPRYPELVSRVDAELKAGDAQLLTWAREVGYPAPRMGALQQAVEEQSKLRSRILPRVLPTALFVWAAVLVAAGRKLASSLAALFRWPAVSRAGLRSWRLPDGALWLLLASLALLVLQWSQWMPTAWTLLLNAALGYCVQGIAVVESLLLARGVPPSIIVLTMLFVFAVAMPVFMLTTVAVGLSDVWLDYRKLEPASDPDQH
jgi:hypothetical protein